MKQDVRLVKNSEGIYDIVASNMDIESTDGFETALQVSLLTDARAPSSKVQSAINRRGWVGNIRTADAGRSLGSILWTYEQSRLTQSIANQIQVDAQNSLFWMVEDGNARSVSASIGQVTTTSVIFYITIETVSGETKSYSILWDKTRGSTI